MGELIASLEKYSIYRVINGKNGIYYLCVPTKSISKCQLYIGFNDKDFSKYTDKRIINSIKNVNDFINQLNEDSIYILLDIPVSILKQASLENDYPEYTKIINNNVMPVVKSVHDLLVSSGVRKKNINQVIQIVEKNEMDKNFTWWAKQICGDSFIKEFDYTKLKGDALEVVDENELDGIIPIEDKPLEQELDTKQVFTSDVVITNSSVLKDNTNTQSKKRVKTKKNSSGFSNFKFLAASLIISIGICIFTFYLLMK